MIVFIVIVLKGQRMRAKMSENGMLHVTTSQVGKGRDCYTATCGAERSDTSDRLTDLSELFLKIVGIQIDLRS